MSRAKDMIHDNGLLKKYRTKTNKSQGEIAKILDTTQQYYGQWELGKRPMPAEKIKILCKIYKISADELLGLKNE